MGTWYVIDTVQVNNVIEKCIVVQDIPTFKKLWYESRTQIADYINDSKYVYKTAYFDDNQQKYISGATIYTYGVNKRFLKTYSNDTAKDNLDNLPGFKM